MAEDRARLPQLRRALFGGVRRQDVAALQEALAVTQEELRVTRAALDESAGWAARLPLALSALAGLAAGDGQEDGFEHLAVGVREVVGCHLLASVELAYVYSATSTEQEERTEWHGPGEPRSTDVRLGSHVLRCAWQPSVLAGEDTVAVVVALCRAVLLGIFGLEAAGVRETRGVVTQLGDFCALERHVALRERLGQPTSRLAVYVDEHSAGEHRGLFGKVAWEASFADAGAVLEEVAHRFGGQAYQVDGLIFGLLVDRDRGADAHAELQERLSGRELVFDVRVL
jgi:hypothetical protein